MHAIFHERRYLIPFRTALLPQIFTDVLVVGGGVAGLRAALAAAEHGEVILVLKGDFRSSNTWWAQGGVACAMGPGDSAEQHIADTLAAGAELCDRPVVEKVVREAAERIREVMGWGVAFDRDSASGALAFGREGGHSRARVLHAEGDATGRVLVGVLERRVRANERIRIFENCRVVDLLTLEGSPVRCVGAMTHHPRYGLQVIWARATILASGGCGQVFRESTNPPTATGDGLAMAFRAGAELADMAFVQFHPTTLYVAGAARSLITEAVRGEGAVLVDRDGRRFMREYHEQADLAPRDIVARAIIRQMQKTSYTHVYLDARHLGTERFRQRFPAIFQLLQKYNIDPGRDLIPIHPSAHYMIGGVRTDLSGRTNIHGLYAVGEVACSGLHGANRLASNSLLEGLVLGASVGEVCREMLRGSRRMSYKIVSDVRPSDRAELDLADVRSSLRSAMWRHVGIEREGARLAEVADMFDFWARYVLDKIFDEEEGWEVQNLLTVGALITQAALWRKESRGTHYRLDYPQSDPALRVHELWQRGCDQPRLQAVAESVEEGEGKGNRTGGEDDQRHGG